jgi:hypothetical protein
VGRDSLVNLFPFSVTTAAWSPPGVALRMVQAAFVTIGASQRLLL